MHNKNYKIFSGDMPFSNWYILQKDGWNFVKFLENENLILAEQYIEKDDVPEKSREKKITKEVQRQNNVDVIMRILKSQHRGNGRSRQSIIKLSGLNENSVSSSLSRLKNLNLAENYMKKGKAYWKYIPPTE